ncbi:hypothetical protein Krac_3458 [Ktedonobacter racemifer DSM 44963]|uniref:Uncharacterized protein n=1 Tax=Ktedonobacter racemifer DSM 44963 TaxID=485913 RepID=D6U1I1_KTERA|nr:hypothetical protein Krac_3458 [Ktedonobacter racemifer DSM 44963]
MSLLRICYQHCYFSCSLALFLMLSLLRAASRLNRSRLASPSTTLSYLIGIGSGKISFEASLQAKICYNFVVKSPAICYYERVQGVLIKERGTIHEKHILLYEVVQPFRDKSVSNTRVRHPYIRLSTSDNSARLITFVPRGSTSTKGIQLFLAMQL